MSFAARKIADHSKLSFLWRYRSVEREVFSTSSTEKTRNSYGISAEILARNRRKSRNTRLSCCDNAFPGFRGASVGHNRQAPGPGVVLAWCFRDFRIISAVKETKSERRVPEWTKEKWHKKTRANHSGSPLSFPSSTSWILHAIMFTMHKFFFQIQFFSCLSTENTCRSSVTPSYVIFRELFIFLCIYFIFVFLRPSSVKPLNDPSVTPSSRTQQHVSRAYMSGLFRPCYVCV